MAPVKRSGINPRPGRPKTAGIPKGERETALGRLIERANFLRDTPRKMNPAIYVLVSEANRRGLTEAQLCVMLDRDASSFRRSCFAKAPHSSTIVALAKALDLAPVVARALSHSLSNRDIHEWCQRIAEDIVIARHDIFTNQVGARDALVHHWTKSSSAMKASAEVYILAKHEMWYFPSDSRLGPALGRVECAVRRFGFSLVPFLKDQSPGQTDRMRLAQAWLQLLFMTLGISDTDQDRIYDILGGYRGSEQPATMNDEQWNALFDGIAAAERTFNVTFSNALAFYKLNPDAVRNGVRYEPQ